MWLSTLAEKDFRRQSHMYRFTLLIREAKEKNAWKYSVNDILPVKRRDGERNEILASINCRKSVTLPFKTHCGWGRGWAVMGLGGGGLTHPLNPCQAENCPKSAVWLNCGFCSQHICVLFFSLFASLPGCGRMCRAKTNPKSSSQTIQTTHTASHPTKPTFPSMRRNNNPQTNCERCCDSKAVCTPEKRPENKQWGYGDADGGDGDDGDALPIWSVVSVHFSPGVVKVTVLLLLLQILADTGSDRAGVERAGRIKGDTERERGVQMGPDALADWHTDTHFLFAAHNLPNEACHSPSPPFNSSLADCHLMRFMDE